MIPFNMWVQLWKMQTVDIGKMSKNQGNPHGAKTKIDRLNTASKEPLL